MNRRKFALVGGMILVIAGGLTLAARATTTPITNGIVGWWLFNEASGQTANDSSGPYNNGIYNNGTLTGASLFASDALKGNVLSVYNISGEVDYPFTTTLEPATGTVSVWVKPTVAQTADVVRQDTDMLIRCNYSGAWYAYDLRIDAKGTPIAIIANDNPKTCGKSPQIVTSGPSNLVKLNQWTHLAMEWDGGTVYLFVNGKKVASSAYNANPTYGLSYHGTSPMKVAAAIWDFNNGFLEYVGAVHDLRIYSRALTSTEINEIYMGQ